MLEQAELDELWDFSDLTASAERIIAAVRSREDASERAELLTQAARVMGLGGDYDTALAALHTITETEPVVLTRIALERGRVLNSAGRTVEALPQFLDALAHARRAGLVFLEVDTLHMLAIVNPQNPEWAAKALDVLQGVTDERTLRWRVSIFNNLGWALKDAGEKQGARFAFLSARDAATRYGTTDQQRWAAEALAELDA